MVLYMIPNMGPVNIVIDTNVLVAALRSSRGASYKLLLSLPQGYYKPCVSVPLFVEYEAVIKRKEVLNGLNAEDIDSILNYLLSQSSIRKIFYLWRPVLKDPKDDLVLEVAVESQSQYIVTFNKKDFQGIDKFDIKAVTPREFLSEMSI